MTVNSSFTSLRCLLIVYLLSVRPPTPYLTLAASVNGEVPVSPKPSPSIPTGVLVNVSAHRSLTFENDSSLELFFNTKRRTISSPNSRNPESTTSAHEASITGPGALGDLVIAHNFPGAPGLDYLADLSTDSSDVDTNPKLVVSRDTADDNQEASIGDQTSFSRPELRQSENSTTLFEICSEIQQNSGATCSGRCGSKPQVIPGVNYVTCACDDLCWLYFDCCDDIAYFCPSQLRKRLHKFPQLSVGFPICLFQTQVIADCQRIGETSSVPPQTSASETPSTVAYTGPAREEVYGVASFTPHLNLLDALFLVVDQTNGILFEYSAYVESCSFHFSNTSVSFIPLTVFFTCQTPVFTLPGLELMSLPCNREYHVDIPESLKRPCGENVFQCGKSVQFNMQTSCKNFNTSDESYAWMRDETDCIIREVWLKPKPRPDPAHFSAVMTMRPEDDHYRVEFLGLLETSLRCYDIHRPLTECVLDNCLSGAVMLVNSIPDKDLPQAMSIYSLVNEDSDLPPTVVHSGWRGPSGRVEEKRRCIMPVRVVAQLWSTQSNGSQIQIRDPSTCSCLKINAALMKLEIWDVVASPGDLCMVSLNGFKKTATRDIPKVYRVLSSSFESRREMYIFPDLEALYSKASALCHDLDLDASTETFRPEACFFQDQKYHIAEDEPEVCIYLKPKVKHFETGSLLNGVRAVESMSMFVYLILYWGLIYG